MAKKLLNIQVENRDVYPSTSRYKGTRYYNRETRRGVFAVEPESWEPPTIPESELTQITEVTAGEVGSLDLVSRRVYGTPALYWVIGIANNIIDEFNELTVGKKLRYPPFSYISANILV